MLNSSFFAVQLNDSTQHCLPEVTLELLPSYSDCFFCGAHGDGLKMRIRFENGAVFSHFVLDPKFQGWDNLAHGGIVTGILDEVMWWTVFALTGTITVTRKMETEYLSPVLCGTEYKVTAELLKQRHGNIYVSGAIADSAGKAVTRAQGLFRAARHATLDELVAKLDFSRTSPEMRQKLLDTFDSHQKET